MVHGIVTDGGRPRTSSLDGRDGYDARQRRLVAARIEAGCRTASAGAVATGCDYDVETEPSTSSDADQWLADVFRAEMVRLGDPVG
jgi:hypothetical protein